MTHFRSTTLTLLLASTQPLFGQALPDNHQFSGWIELEQVSFDGGNETLIAADVTLKLRPAAMNGFGFDLGVQGIQMEGIGFSAVYGTVVMPLAGGELSFGIPRTAFQRIFGTNAFAGAQLLGIEIGLTSSTDATTLFNMQSDVNSYGAGYDNTYGNTRVSAGLYKLDTVTGAQVAVEYSLPNTVLRIGAENLTGDSFTLTNLALGATTTMGKVELAGFLRHAEQDAMSADSLRLDAQYSVSDALDLTASYVTSSQGFSNMYGLSAAYTFVKTAYVQTGLVNADGNSAYDISLGVKF